MPYSGATYTAPANSWNPAVGSTTISATDWNALLTDLVAAFNSVPPYAIAQENNYRFGGIAGGTANALTATLSPALPAYANGTTVWVYSGASANSGDTTLAVNGLAATQVLLYGVALTGGEIPANTLCQFTYYNSKWHLFAQATGAVPAKLTIRTVTGTDTLLPSDRGKAVEATSGTFTWSVTAAATLGAGWWCYVKNSGTGVPTLDPNSSETIDGLTTLPIATTEGFILYCDGSNFKTIGRGRNGLRTVSGTTDTITPADNGRIISYTNTGGCTITVSALATLGAGFYCDIDNNQGTSAITLNRSGSDVFEGSGTAVTLAAFANDGRSRIRLETRSAGLIYTSLRQFRSTAQTITAAAQVQVAHGLGAVPKRYWLVLRCTTAELGYSVGDEVIYPTAGATLSAGAAANAGAAMRADATNLTVRFGSLAATLNVTRADTGAGANITLGSWAAHLCGEF